MILSAQTIKALCHPDVVGFPMITPFYDRSVHKSSGTTFGLSPAGYDIRVKEEFNLWPGEFELASTVEFFTIPKFVLATVHDKSTWARKGIAVQNTVIEPGWSGFLTIELTNHSEETFPIVAGMPIAQVIFHKLDMPTDAPYSGRYQNQESGPQMARFER